MVFSPEWCCTPFTSLGTCTSVNFKYWYTPGWISVDDIGDEKGHTAKDNCFEYQYITQTLSCKLLSGFSRLAKECRAGASTIITYFTGLYIITKPCTTSDQQSVVVSQDQPPPQPALWKLPKPSRWTRSVSMSHLKLVSWPTCCRVKSARFRGRQTRVGVA